MKATNILIISALACMCLGLILQAFGNDLGIIALLFGLVFSRATRKEFKRATQEPKENTFIPKI